MTSYDQDLELTILMPCLNEAETLETVIRKAQGYLECSQVEGEVLVADNGSTDGSQEIARSLGARVIEVPERGYGSALIAGIRSARGRYVIMGDADDSYDFTSLDPFVQQLRAGNALVMGNRFQGGIAEGAMPPLHRYLGNPVLSGIGRLFFRAPVGDFHCGLRGFDRNQMLDLGLCTAGMEFASEMVVKSCLAKVPIAEVPTTLSPDGRSRAPHLRSWRDGWRHLRFLLIFSPRWLFLFPGLLALLLGVIATTALLIRPVTIGTVGFDVATLIYTSALAVIGYQATLFHFMTKVYAAHEGFLPTSPRFQSVAEQVSVERGLVGGIAIFLFGLGIAFAQLLRWGEGGFGGLDPQESVRVAVPAMLGLTLGFQTIMASMFVGILTIPTARGLAAGPRLVPGSPERLPA